MYECYGEGWRLGSFRVSSKMAKNIATLERVPPDVFGTKSFLLRENFFLIHNLVPTYYYYRRRIVNAGILKKVSNNSTIYKPIR